MRHLVTAATAATALTLALTATACGSGGGSGPAGSSGSGGRAAVLVSFYPLQFLAERIGGEHVAVTNLTKPGVEPHDLELTPQDVAAVSSARLAIYAKGFQPAVDKALAEQSAAAFDVTPSADLTLQAAEEGHEHGDGHDHGGADPHFWLDPVRYKAAAAAVAGKLGETDPSHRADFERNSAALAADLDALHKEFSAGLKTCTSRDLVTGHAAFGYLAQRYNLTQEAIAGLSPEQEPDPKRLADLAAHVKEHHVSTVYTETLVDPAVAKTVAAETGARTAVLDPLEGLTQSSAGSDYLQVMRANLATLRKGQACS